MDLNSKLAKLIEDIAKDLELELVDFDFFESGTRKILRVYIDKEEGITVEHCSRLSRDLGYALDLEDIIPDAYHLEVSSPGIDRPLTTQKDFLRTRERLVKIRLSESEDGTKKIVGKVIDALEDRVKLSVDGKDVEVEYDKMLSAKIELEF